MKIYGLLGLLISGFSIGAIANGQVVTDLNVYPVANYMEMKSTGSFSQPNFASGGSQVVTPPVYVDASVVPATFVSPGQTTIASPLTVNSNFKCPPGQTASLASKVRTGLAQSKAATAARLRLRGHLGGGLGGARYEGVGWSTQSAQAAIQNCCYWGTRPVSEIGISKGSDGYWYACVLYQ